MAEIAAHEIGLADLAFAMELDAGSDAQRKVWASLIARSAVVCPEDTMGRFTAFMPHMCSSTPDGMARRHLLCLSGEG